MWVMEETDGPSSDPPQTGHLRQKVHAQQFPASSSERSVVTDGPSIDTPQTGHLRQKVHAQQYPASSLERSAVSSRMTGWLL